MSHPLLPKNLNKDNALFRQGKPDYTKLSTDAFPTPTVDEAGAILESSDTGNRYRWTGAAWAPTHTKGSVNVHDKDLDTALVAQRAHLDTGVSSTLSVATVVGDRTLTLVSSVGFLVGDYLQIDAGVSDTHFPTIISIAAPVLTLDGPVDAVHAIGATITVVDLAMAATIGTGPLPIIYKIQPPVGELWHIARLIITMTHGTAGDLGLLGNIAAVANGIIVRTYIGGVYETLANWKSNADLNSSMYDVKFDTRSGGGGTFGTSGRMTLLNFGGLVALSGANSDRIEFLIQDDLTGLTSFGVNGQGHVEDILI